jgi:hypothetical protein
LGGFITMGIAAGQGCVFGGLVRTQGSHAVPLAQPRRKLSRHHLAQGRERLGSIRVQICRQNHPSGIAQPWSRLQPPTQSTTNEGLVRGNPNEISTKGGR